MKSIWRYCGSPGWGPVALGAAWLRGGSPPTWPWLATSRTLLVHHARVAIARVCRDWGLRPGDEVLVPAYNCGSEIDPLVWYGLDVRFYRITETARLDLDDLMRRITSRTRLVCITHFFGWLHQLDEFYDRVARVAGSNIRVLEDFACAMFTEPSGQQRADAHLYAFPKFMHVPDGGAIVFRDPPQDWPLRPPSPWRIGKCCATLVRKGFVLRLQRAVGPSAAAPFGRCILEKCHLDGDAEPDIPEHYYFNGKLFDHGMSRVARGLLGRFTPDQIVVRRRENYRGLFERLAEVPGITPLYADLPPEVCPLVLPLRVQGGARARDALVNNLRRFGVEAIPWWYGFHRAFSWEGFDDARSLKQSVVVLPVLPHLSTRDLDFIALSLTGQGAVRGG